MVCALMVDCCVLIGVWGCCLTVEFVYLSVGCIAMFVCLLVCNLWVIAF